MSDIAPSAHGGIHQGEAPDQGPPDPGAAGVQRGSSAESLPPPVVQGLQVGRLLGRGGSSAVWLVTDEGGRRFALKVGALRAGARDHPVAGVRRGRRTAQFPAGATAPAPSAVPAGNAPLPGREEERPAQDRGVGAEGMERELRLLQQYSHEHLLRVHRIVGTDQGPGMLMDLAPGGSLSGLVTSRGPLPIPEVVTALVPIAQVLGHLHGAGALHGDVTPGNILFTAEGKPLLGDFGTARLLGSDHGAAAGTPGFIDPTRGGSFDPGGDVFALAAVSWFALTGRVPGPTEQRPPLALIVPEVPQQLMQLIEDGLGPRDRRPTADHFARILLASAAPGPVNLVPAVHASVLPELLTRHTGTRPVPPASPWTRIIGGRRSAGKEQPDGVRRRPPPRRKLPRSGVPAGAVAPPGTVRRGEPGRKVIAVAAGAAALVLLVAGIAVTLGGFGPSAVPSGLLPGAGSSHAPGPGASAADGAPDRGQTDPGLDGPGGLPEGPGVPEAPEGREGAGGAGDPPAGADAPRDAALLDDDPATALRRLAALRARAFTTADTAVLATVDVEGSPALAADRKAVAALADSGRNLEDLSIDIRDPVVLGEADLAAMPAVGSLPGVTGPPAGTEVTLIRATAALSSYTESAASVRRAGAEPGPLMAAGRQELIFVLWNSGSGWRIHSVVSPPG